MASSSSWHYRTDHSPSPKRRHFYKDGYRSNYDPKIKDNEDSNINQADSFENDYDATVLQDGGLFSSMDQESDEIIWVKDSCNITVTSTDTQAGVSLQVGLQLAIALVLSITIGDTERGESVAQELLQYFNSDQTNKQKILICNSKDATVTTTDTDLAINIQVLLQVLVALVVIIDIL
ncbi:spore coat protein [Priestia endophytica]|uniref:spore coat protein n=1 Tax=Priestia endophytica TaxID=135735 RepID=UPI00227F2429|nr:spore coat protein [Priestia endophytica]MCY8233771.1 spore coat protein [Priestia endophytica]